MPKTILPPIPDIRSLAGLDPAIIKFFEAIKGHLETLDGRGNEDDRALRVGDLLRIGINKVALETQGSSYNFESLLNSNVGLRYWVATSVTQTKGTTSDAVADLQYTLDGNFYAIAEVADTPGIDLAVNFTNVTKIGAVLVRAYYVGTHAARVQLYNYTDSAWETLYALENSADYSQFYLNVEDGGDHIDSNGDAKVRLYHTEAGDITHDLYVDYVGLAYRYEDN